MSAEPNGDDAARMRRAVARAEHSRLLAPPNPWVGAVLVTTDGVSFEGSTRRPGGNHAELQVIERAGSKAEGATLYVTLEPCHHQGRTPPCSRAVIDAGISRVVYSVDDPDPRVAGQGAAAMRAAGLEVDAGVLRDRVEEQLAPYLHHRRTGRSYVVLKLAATLDGRTAAPDRSSTWITGPEARADVQRLRAESDAIAVGAGTVRADDPRLTVRDVIGPDGRPVREPLRVVFGRAPDRAAVRPCLELEGSPQELLVDLGRRDVLQVLIEGGAEVAGRFHRAGLIDRYVLYYAPALMGGDDGLGMFAGPGAPTIDEVWRGTIRSVSRLGSDFRVELDPLT